MNILAKRAFVLAHKIRLNFSEFGKALKFAWKKVKLHAKLQKLCFFQFKKKNGELRDALGTINPDYMNYEFKGGGYEKWYLIRFWETNKEQWRSLDVRRLVQVYW